MLRIAVDDEIEIRLLQEHHAEEMFAVIDRNRQHIRQWLPWPDFTHSPDDSLEFIHKCLVRFERREEIACGIWCRSRLSGGIGAQLDRASRTASLGYWIDRELEGRGIVIRSAKAMLRYLFVEWNCARVEIRCATGNRRSRAIPERLGFRHERTLPGAFVLGEQILDIELYAMLRPEWESAIAHEPA
jgi:ribosomal-protein-serine acetyltransferase